MGSTSARAESTLRELEMSTPSSELGKLSNIKSGVSRVVPSSADSLQTESTFGANNQIKVVNQSLNDANAQ